MQVLIGFTTQEIADRMGTTGPQCSSDYSERETNYVKSSGRCRTTAGIDSNGTRTKYGDIDFIKDGYNGRNRIASAAGAVEAEIP